MSAPEPMACEICGERFSLADAERGDVAEMYDPAAADPDSKICHAECGLAAGMEIA